VLYDHQHIRAPLRAPLRSDVGAQGMGLMPYAHGTQVENRYTELTSVVNKNLPTHFMKHFHLP